ncbi:MAG TPA: FxsA family protein [Ureibacillus sp.]|nr:FxsA family protein [Ureibacillus sp.]
MKKLKISLIAVVLIEIALFIVVGRILGVFNTLLLVILTSIIGITVAKKQGMKSVQNIQTSMSIGEAPGPAMVDTFMIFVGGILLAAPGFLTDLIGFTFVFSFSRKLYKPFIYKWLRKKMENGPIIIINK